MPRSQPSPPKIERVPWAELGPEFYRVWGWPNGRPEAEHVSVVGPTGSGKSMFQSEIVTTRAALRGSYVVVIATKPADATLRKTGWPIVNKWPPPWGKHERVIFWPKAGKPIEGVKVQRVAIGRMLNEIWRPDAHTILVFDEIAYVEQELGLKTIVDRYWREGRSLGFTLVAGTQRPRNVSRYMWSEPSWSVAFPPADEDEAKRVAEIVGGRSRFANILTHDLKRHEFLLVNRREKIAYISKLGT